MVVNVLFVNVGTYDESVVALGEAHCQLAPQPVCLLRCNLAGDKGLPEVVGNHIIRAACPSGFLDILFLEQQKFCICDLTAALIAGDELSAFCFLRVLNVVDDIPDCGAECAALSNVKRHQARGGQRDDLLTESYFSAGSGQK